MHTPPLDIMREIIFKIHHWKLPQLQYLTVLLTQRQGKIMGEFREIVRE